jgi:hypothetical protein
LEDLGAEVEINSELIVIRENIKISANRSLCYYELKRNMPWFDEGCSKLWNQRKYSKLQWLKDSSEMNKKPADMSGIKKRECMEDNEQ